MTPPYNGTDSDAAVEQARQTALELFGSAGDALVVLDRELRVLEWTPRLEQLSGHTRAQMVGSSITRLFPDDHRSWPFRQALEGRMQTLRAQCFALPDASQDSRYDSYYLPLQDARGNVVACAGVVRDRKELHDLHGQLFESEKRFRTMADCAPVLLWMAGPDARCDFFNQTWLNFRGRSLAQEHGFGWAEGVHPAEFQMCMDVYMDAFRERREFEMVYRLRRHDGVYRWILDHGAPRFGPANEFLGYIGSCTDITDRKDAEDAVRKASDRLARSNAELERFAHAASHDLQEPLRMVINFTSLLAQKYQGALDAEGQEYIGFATDGAKRMKELIDGLLALASVKQVDEQRMLRLEPTKLVRRSLDNLRLLIQETGAEIDVGNLPAVRGNAAVLGQVFQNLLHNALKFRRGTPQIRVSALGDERVVHFTISDNGIGIDMRYAEKVFVLFQRLHPRSEYPGSGIGLGLCKQIIELHGGRIWIEGEPQRGTTVHFTLPGAGSASETPQKGA
ncbi:MAG TPA: ATP-binding protein [Polyangiales bacterium]|nr:ATP-binding protein [Polyangiales bacterium]